MSGIRLIAMDMDGTLLGAELDRIPPRNVEALRGANEKGITLAQATGRLPDDAGFFALDAGLPMHVLSLNGCVWQREPLGEVLDARLMQPDAARKARGLMEELDMAYSLFGMHEAALDRPPEDVRGAMLVLGTFLDRPGGRTRFWPDGRHIEPLLERTSKFVVVGDAYPDRLNLLKARLIAEVPEVEVTSSWADTLEIIPAGVNKGAALTALARRLDIPMSEVMAIGDNDNDVSMLEAAGCAVAMANATPAAKEAAHWIAPSNLEDGVAAAVRALALDDAACRGLLRPGQRLLK
ncbi:MAG: HAD family phosphatase [Christensenellaceae bacterium]|nr:HAD family phosphatase [Christensenellaceae bacterium]